MKKLSSCWVLFLLLGWSRPALSQQTELTIRGGVDLANFLGAGATNDLTVKGNFYETGTPPAYQFDPFLRNPYSRRVGIGSSFGIRGQRVGQHGGLVAFEIGVDQASSGRRVGQFDGTPPLWPGAFQLTEPATGRAGLTRWGIPFFFGIGHRWRAGEQKHLDFLLGPELGWVIAAHERGEGTHSGQYTSTTTAWEVNIARQLQHQLDLRLRADITFWIQRLGVNANYSWGITDLQDELANLSQFYVPGSVHAQTIRIGIAYRLH